MEVISADCPRCTSANTVQISSNSGAWHCRQCGHNFNGKGHA